MNLGVCIPYGGGGGEVEINEFGCVYSIWGGGGGGGNK